MPLSANERMWLGMIRAAEGTHAGGPFAKNDADGYRMYFGGKLFDDFSRHPNVVNKTPGYSSAAAGAYQFMPPTWNRVSKHLGLKDFSPASQDQAALQLIRWRGVDPSKDPVTRENVAKLAPEWASLPTIQGKSYYGQPVKSFDYLQNIAKQYSVPVAQPAPKPAQPVAGAPVSRPSSSGGGSAQKKPRGAAPAPVAPIDRAKDYVKQNLKGLFKTFGLINAVPEPKKDYFDLAMQLDAEDDPRANEFYERAFSSGGVVSEDEGTVISEQLPGMILSLLVDAAKKRQTSGSQIAAAPIAAPPVDSEDNQRTAAVNPSAQRMAAVKPSTGPVVYKGAILTSAKDATGEPGLDFVIAGGRGAQFLSPFDAEVVEVVGNQNWETNLEKNPSGKRGYGNYVDLRAVGPDGKPFDIRLAHFDAVNSSLRPGMKIGAGTPIGSQGRTGSTTGAHISMDFYDPGATTTSPSILRLRDQTADRIRRGLPLL